MSEIHRIRCGNVNCYIVENGAGGVLVDTGRREFARRVLEACRRYRVRLIVLTHGHFDHAENAAFLSEALGVPIGMSGRDLDLISSNANPALSAETLLGKVVLSASLREFSRRSMRVFEPEVLLQEGACLTDYGIDARSVVLTGHPAGCIGLDVEETNLVVGDALMNMFYPTVSMLFHNRGAMLESAEKISTLGRRMLYFGHGRPVSNRQWVK